MFDVHVMSSAADPIFVSEEIGMVSVLNFHFLLRMIIVLFSLYNDAQ